GVALNSPGSRSAPWETGQGKMVYPEGVAQKCKPAPLCNPFGVGKQNPSRRFDPGCAARPWAIEYDPFGVGWLAGAMRHRYHSAQVVKSDVRPTSGDVWAKTQYLKTNCGRHPWTIPCTWSLLNGYRTGETTGQNLSAPGLPSAKPQMFFS